MSDLEILTMGISFTIYSEGENIDRAWPFDVIPRLIPGEEWERVSRGSGAAAAGAQHVHRRHLQRPADHRRRHLPEGTAGGRDELPRGVPRRPSEVRGVGTHLRIRSRPGRRRPVLRVGGQPARAVRCQLRAREPGGREAHVPRAVRAPPDPPGRRLHRRAQQAADVARARRTPRSADRRAHPRHLQLGLLRALVPRPADGRRARRGRRPDGRRRQLRLHEDGAGAGTGRCDLPTDRRPVPRSRGVQSRLDARRARADAGLEGRQRRHRQRARRRRGRRQVRLRLGARHDPLLPERGAADRQRADVPVHVRRRVRLRARPPRRTGAEAGERIGRLRHRHRRPGDARGARDGRGGDPGRPAELGRPADPRPVDRADARGRGDPAPPPRSAAVRPHRQGRATSPPAD